MTTHRLLNRIFNANGRMLMVAMDHTAFLDKPVGGLLDYGKTVREASRAGADSFLVPGIAIENYAADFGNTSVFATVSTNAADRELAVARAAAAGADGVKTISFPLEQGDTTVADSAAVAAHAKKYGMPFLAEPIPGGFSSTTHRTPEAIAAGARIAVENGADIVKTFYTGDAESMKLVVKYADKPVIILGGHAKDSLAELYAPIHDAIHISGVVGVAIGTNIWTSSNPGGVVRGLSVILHENGSVEEAVKAAEAWKPAE